MIISWGSGWLPELTAALIDFLKFTATTTRFTATCSSSAPALRGSRIRRDSEDDLDKNDEVAPTEAVLDEDFIGTTEAPFIPMETTASPINEEIWNEQKSTLAK